VGEFSKGEKDGQESDQVRKKISEAKEVTAIGRLFG
jgi:hypothetical protein